MVFSGGRRSIFFYYNRKEIGIASLAGSLAMTGGSWHYEKVATTCHCE
jgi:hypothetical protein